MDQIKIDKNDLPRYLEIFKRELQNNSDSRNTVKTYSTYLSKFLDYSCRLRDVEPMERIALFINSCKSPQTRSQAYSAIKLFYRYVLKKKMDYSIKHRKKKDLFPDVWSKQDILQLLDNIKNIKHRVMLAMLYGSGLRVSEVVKLRIKDLNIQQKMLRVDKAKGHKSRLTLLSEKLIDPLNEMIRNRDSNDFIFITQSGKPYSPRTVQEIFYKAALRAGIKKRGSCHTLRHSFATHLMENGVNVKSIQKMLGHKKVDTTMIYVHVASLKDTGISSPL